MEEKKVNHVRIARDKYLKTKCFLDLLKYQKAARQVLRKRITLKERE